MFHQVSQHLYRVQERTLIGFDKLEVLLLIIKTSHIFVNMQQKLSGKTMTFSATDLDE